METKLAVKRITYDEAVAHLHRDGQQAYDYMAADCVIARVAELEAALRMIYEIPRDYTAPLPGPAMRMYDVARAALKGAK